MKFTDYDLKRLKERQHGQNMSLTAPKMYALIARLRAAERVVSAIEKIVDLNFEDGWRKHIEEIVDAHDAWRKAAGK